MNTTLSLMLAPELPSGFSGLSYNGSLNMNEGALQVSEDWKENAPIIADVQPCNGTCTAIVRAPGVTLSKCSSTTWSVTEEDMLDGNATWGPWRSYDSVNDFVGNPMFYVRLGYLPVHTPQRSQVAALETGMLQWWYENNNLTFVGSYVDTICYYSPAILEYEVSIQGKRFTIVKSGKTISIANNTVSFNADLAFSQIQLNTIDALTLYLNLYVGANASMIMSAHPEPGDHWGLSPLSSSSSAGVAKYLDYSGADSMRFKDPTSDILADLNEMMFRAAVLSTTWSNITSLMDEGLSVEQTLHSTQTVTENVYHADLRWFAGAAVLELLAVLFVLPLFWGWWKLDKVQMLSPFDLALAFDAPLLKDVNSATGVQNVVKQMGDVQVRFGMSVENAKVSRPGNDEAGVGSVASFRLGFAESHMVSEPPKGMRFDL
ncbi:hypothetical protein LTR97_007629 [Elasticomyces elasticus]|uniref:Uncharacterized protein n=1 Tax=Elasticomyces elasticus TaxID=574655 RepID=A0AAN7ZMW3_9PEZI|nr:hypothetical protein LTR97_007629 [Elasticomyces elasticus]